MRALLIMKSETGLMTTSSYRMGIRGTWIQKAVKIPRITRKFTCIE